MSILDRLPEDSELKGEHVTFYTRFLFGTLFAYIISSALYDATFIPDSILVVVALFFLVFWLGMPIALRRDKRYVAEHSEWNPSRVYYLGFLPGYLGLGVLAYYLYKRTKTFDDGGELAEIDEELTP